jgi:hypothetical protein
MESGCWTERVFHHLGWARRPSPSSGEIEPSAELVVPDTFRHNGRVLVQKGIGSTELQPCGLNKPFAEIVYRPKDRS